MVLLSQIIVWFSMILFALFIYLKILNIGNVGAAKIVCGIFLAAALTFGIYYVKMPYVSFSLMVLLLGAFAGIAANTRFDLALTGIVLSVGISYGLVIISTSIITFFTLLITGTANDLFIALFSVVLQFALIKLLFSIRRLKKGILFLKEKNAGAIGLIISGVIFVAIILIPNQNISREIKLFFIIGAILSVAGLIIWWRRGLTRLYRERMRERDMQELEATVAEKDVQIQKLQESSEYMAKQIHRDNKLLAAMYEAVSAVEGDNPIQKQIDALMRERMGALIQSQKVHKAIPTTKDDMVDSVMKAMLVKAAEEGIQFDITLIGELSELIEMVTPIKFNTLLADLIDNAIIATSYSEYKRILIMIGSSDGCYELNVQDSGIPFQADTLMKLGKEKASTHLDEGGSGIGWLAISEILREHKASVIITEHPPKKFGFTKTVKLRFDGNGEYIVQSFRGLLQELQQLT